MERREALWLLLFTALAAVPACSDEFAVFCSHDNECPGGFTCTTDHACLKGGDGGEDMQMCTDCDGGPGDMLPDATADGADLKPMCTVATDCTDPAKPVCNGMGVCAKC